MWNLPVHVEINIRDLLRAGRVRDAIDLFRKHTRANLLEAEEAVHLLYDEIGGPDRQFLAYDIGPAKLTEAEKNSLGDEPPAHVLTAIDNLLRGGHELDATKLYHKYSNKDLRESMIAIEAIIASAGRGFSARSRARTDGSDEETGGVFEHIKAGRKIEAIKVHRMATGLGLKEAKKQVERMADEILVDNPEGRKEFDRIDWSGPAFYLLAGILIILAILIASS